MIERSKLGATLTAERRVQFRVWAPERDKVEVALETQGSTEHTVMERQDGGYHQVVLSADPGMRYRYRLDGKESFPDPCSRAQPDGPHGASMIVDPARYRWSDLEWKGLELRGQVIYELHVGTFSKEGTYAGAAEKLPHLQALGITCLELMPLATFPGAFNWGYDGVSLFAPCSVYGDPDQLRAFVDHAHRLGLGVIHDVVYNHLGPDGNYLTQFSPTYFTDEYPAEWGTPLRFEGEEARGVRDFFVQNAAMWIDEFHFDGLRLDATQSLHDRSDRHIVGEVGEAVRLAGGKRHTLLISESEPQDPTLVLPAKQGGCGGDGVWIDDFHHAARVAVVGDREAYFTDYRGTAQELVSCALFNSLYQGQHYAWHKKPRGSSLLRVEAPHLVFYLQNHDQVSNSLRGARLHLLAGEVRTRAITALWLLLPQTPMFFMGQEFFASAPFHFFVDHHDELMKAVRKGRQAFLSQFPSTGHALEKEAFTVPLSREAFDGSRLDWSEAEARKDIVAFHRELLRLRRTEPAFAAQDRRALLGATLSDSALVLRYPGPTEEDERLVVCNLGADLTFDPCPVPLLAPVDGYLWKLMFSSEDSRYGGRGAVAPTGEGPWKIPGQTTVVLAPETV